MTFGEMQADARRKINEATSVFFSDQDIKDGLNEGLMEMADATEYFERYVNVSMLAGRTYYDLTSLTPETFLSPRRIWNATTQKWLEPTDCREQDYHTVVQWELTHGEPGKYLLRGNWWLGVFPKCSADGTVLRVYHTALPDLMSASTDEPDFPREFHAGVVELGMSDLLSQVRETARALKYWASAQSYVEGLRRHVDGRQHIPKMGVV